MREEHRRKIGAIMAEMQCPKGFACAENGFVRLCEARDFGVDKYVDCLDGSPVGCPFALAFGGGHLCRCPLRVYLAKMPRDGQDPPARVTSGPAASRH